MTSPKFEIYIAVEPSDWLVSLEVVASKAAIALANAKVESAKEFADGLEKHVKARGGKLAHIEGKLIEGDLAETLSASVEAAKASKMRPLEKASKVIEETEPKPKGRPGRKPMVETRELAIELKTAMLNGEKPSAISKRTGVNQRALYNLGHGLTWKDIEPAGDVLDLSKPIDWKTAERMRLAHEKGVSMNQIVADEDSSWGAVYSVINGDRPKHRRPWSEKQLAQLKSAIAKTNIKTVAEKLGVSQHSLKHIGA